MMRTKVIWGVLTGLAVLAIAALVWPPNQDIRDIEKHASSTDLAADVQAMWQTAPLASDSELEGSTHAAIQASSRVFNRVELVGKTGAEVIELLGSPTRSSRSTYRGQPFWPLQSRGMIYRFDCGSYGWQFNVYCGGDDQLVTEVERRWIH